MFFCLNYSPRINLNLFKGVVSPNKMDYRKLTEAMRFAVYKHRLQKRKNDNAAYIIHPFGVEEKLEKAGVKDVDILCAAILHDTVEDTETTLEEIESQFGENVREMVNDVTDDKSLPKHERKLRQIEKVDFIAEGSLLIKLADKLDNLQDILEYPPINWNNERVSGYIIWSRAVTEKIRNRAHFHFQNNHCFSYLLGELEKIYEKSGVSQSGMTLEKYIEMMKI